MGKALFWDFDGTLIHPNESFLDAMKHAITVYYHSILATEIRSFLHTTCSWYTPEISYVGETGQKWWTNLFCRFDSFYKQHNIPKAEWEKINAAFQKEIWNPDNYTLYSDALAVLHRSGEMGFQNYILSNNYPELPLVIDKLGLSGYFTDYIVSSNVGYEKPRKELFDFARSIAQNPNCCYMIGDNPAADIGGGILAGMKTILVHRSGDFGADAVCESLSEIPSLLAEWEKAD